MEYKTVPISVVIPTYKRINDLKITIEKIKSCLPLPSEIVIHVDGGDQETAQMLTSNFSDVKILISKAAIGPGGGRNLCIQQASNEYVASFDDDSYPYQLDYFERLYKLFNLFPHASVIESSIFHQNEDTPKEQYTFFSCYSFAGCGVAYRKRDFQKIGGYVPTPVAYGLEEVDFSLKAFEKDALFIRTNWLIVFHNTKLTHHLSSKINANAITNLGVLVYLRYPKVLWYYGFLQVLNRVFWSIKKGRFKGITIGILGIPFKTYQLRKYKKTIPVSVIKNYLKKRTIVTPYEL